MKNEVCLDCESDKTIVLFAAEEKRPSGDQMEVFQCEECGLTWKE